jgi:hypothetical protein
MTEADEMNNYRKSNKEFRMMKSKVPPLLSSKIAALKQLSELAISNKA